MKAFRYKVDFNDYDYSDDLWEIYNYLISIGTLNIDPYSLPLYYRKWCKSLNKKDELYGVPYECYDWLADDWIECYNEKDILETFANWLSNQEV